MISLGNLLSRFRRLAWRRCSPTALGSAGQAHAASRVPRIGQQHKLQAISGTHCLCSHLNGRASRSIAIAAGLVILSMALATATALAEPHIIDFEELEPGEQVTQLNEIGVVFNHALEGVRCDPDPVVRQSNCLQAKSGTIVAHTLQRDEFRRHVIDITLSEPQDVISASVRYDDDAGYAGREVVVVVNGYDADNNFIGSSTKHFVHDFDDNLADGLQVMWHTVSFRDIQICIPGIPCPEPKQVKRVEIWGGAYVPDSGPPIKDLVDNALLIDAIVIEETGPPLPADTEPPVITVVDLPETTDHEHVDVHLRVEEQGPPESRRLASVDLRVSDPSGHLLLDYSGGLICGGPGSARNCPATQFDETFGIPLSDQPGTYTVSFRACDGAGNCSEVSRSVTLDLPVKVRALALGVEVNQAVQVRIFPVDGPGTARDVAGPRVRIVGGKDTVVRYYLVAEGGTRSGFSATLRVGIWKEGDVSPSIRRNIMPNTDVTAITLPADPGVAGRIELERQLRTDTSRTLNFVIPSQLLQDAVLLDLTLDGVTGLLQVPVEPDVTLGLYTIELHQRGGPTPLEEHVRTMVEHLKAAFPIRALLFPNIYRNRWDTTPSTILPYMVRHADYTGSTRCARVLAWVRSTFSGDTLPLEGAPDFVVTLGVVGGSWLKDCTGMAYLSGTPTAITYPDSNFAPQEIGHTMGIEHAGNAHNEASRGGFERWPYPHGMVSPDGVTAFGVIAQQTGSTADGLGQWRVTLVDPCRNATLDQRLAACAALGEDVMHDFMSYGRPQDWTASVFHDPSFPDKKGFNWPSDITYHRIYGKMLTGELSPPSDSLVPASALNVEQNEERVEALIVAGVIDENGTVELLLPLLRKPLPPSLLQQPDGPYRLVLADGNGNPLAEKSFDVEHIAHHDSDGQFWVAFEYVAGGQRLIIKRDNDTLFEQTASAGRPAVRITSPKAGDILDTGEHLITWEADDPDGDPLSFLVQYSPDNGQSWQGITLVEPGQPQETLLRVDELMPGRQGIVRVTASDGFHTTVAQSARFFSLGTQESPAQPPVRLLYLPLL